MQKLREYLSGGYNNDACPSPRDSRVRSPMRTRWCGIREHMSRSAGERLERLWETKRRKTPNHWKCSSLWHFGLVVLCERGISHWFAWAPAVGTIHSVWAVLYSGAWARYIV